jgi:hypothetical protein
MPHRAIATYIRQRLPLALAVSTALALALVAVGLYRQAQFNDRLIDARQHECLGGNIVRGHIAFLDTSLRDVLVLALAAPPPPGQAAMTPAQLELRARFQEAVDKLSERLPALAPRDCSRSAVSGASPAPAKP